MDKLVSVIVATYNPNIFWLEKQLNSINNQTYSNIEVVLLDDCSKYEKYFDIKETTGIIRRFPLRIYRNDKNLGSNKTFEKLVNFASGDYIAFCDQDDIWNNEKIVVLVNEIENSPNTLLAYSDMKIIDDNDNIISNSMSTYRKRHVFLEGDNLFKQLIYRNFVVGCTMLVKRDIVLKSLPFVDSMVHDHYIALFASCFGNIKFVNKPLITYRQHANNQTSVLKGVNDKKDYEKLQIDVFNNHIKDLENKNELITNMKFSHEIVIAKRWGLKRKIWWNKFDFNSMITIFKLRKHNLKTSIFELLFARFPNFIFEKVIYAIKNKNL
ncbi:glycosyltransferase, group 2 family protein [Peptostreptococcaceae bacterium AS15]|nr:glycosyltransferase, group 2 family protein [Peptostreptococcaceae bacterium AS15]